MLKLKSEYTDVNNVKHNVQHTVLHEKEADVKARILEDLLNALTSKHK